MKLFLASSLLLAATTAKDFPLTSVRSIDGSEEQGGLGQALKVPLVRKSYAAYPDGIGEKIKTEPNARTVSNLIHKQTASIPNDRRLSDMIWAFGQLLDHDVGLTEGDANAGFSNITVPIDKTDILSGVTIPFARAKTIEANSTYREHVNEITAFIDASFVYGSDVERAKALRTGKYGTLNTSAKGLLLPKNVRGFPNAGGTGADLFFAGDIRANEQAGLMAMHTLFVREHNRLCKLILKSYPEAPDEQIYQLARKIVGAEVQIITYEEFLPSVIGKRFAPNVNDYKYGKDIDPGIATEFSTGAYRFGHTMLSPVLLLSTGQKDQGKLSLREAFFNVNFLDLNPKTAVDLLIGGFITQQAQEIDNHVVDDVRSFLFQDKTPSRGGHDLAAFNIQRGRDMGLPTYNEVRKAYGLKPVKNFGQISSDATVGKALYVAYDGDINKVDLWPAAISEDHVEGASCGETLGTIIGEQFARLMNGDEYFYKNDPDLSASKLANIINLDTFGMADVILANTNVKGIDANKNVFFV